MMKPNASNPVKSIEKTLGVLEALLRLRGATIAELHKEMGISKPTIHNHLATLRQYGYVYKRRDEYHLGLRWLEFGGFVRDQLDFFTMAEKAVDEIAAQTGELALVTTEEFGKTTYIYKAKGQQGVSTDAYLGIRLPMHCTGTGKAMLAEFSEEKVTEIVNEHGLPAYTNNTITDKDALFEELEKIRQQGFATDNEERITGMKGIAVAITHETDETVLGALSLTAPTHRLPDKKFTEEFPNLLSSLAREIEINTAYR